MSRDLPDLFGPGEQTRPAWLRVLCLAGAGFFFVLGLIGWLIPLVSGIPFYVLGLVLLGMGSDRARAWINRTERKLPGRWRVALRRVLRK